MSLHALANHMAAQGRNNDSMLVHMTPKEVGGLHALAIANGGQLTINPETGLTEAGFLQDLLPALVGFGLNTFLPGLGTAVGGAFGLGAAAGTGIAVGGLTALATGNLSKGVMAGFGAYGGAGLGESLMGAGVNAATNAGTAGYESILADKGFIPGTPEYGAAASELALGAQKTALAATPMDRLTAGFSATTQSPEALMNYAKNNGKNLLLAGAPALMGGLSEEDETVTKMPSTGMITPFVMNQKAVPRDNSLSPSAQQRYFNYDVTPITPVKAANGGAVQHFANGGAVNDTDPFTQQFLDKAKTYQNTMTGDSASAFDYLMGNTRPPAQTTGGTGGANSRGTVRAPVGMQKPAVPASTEGIQALADIVRGGGGGGAPASSTGITGVYNPDVNSYTNGILPALLGQQAVPAPIVDTTGYSSVAEAESAQNQAEQAQQAAAQAEQAQQAAAVSTPVTYSPITTSDLPSNDNYSNENRNSGYSGGYNGGYSGPASGATSAGSAPGASASSAAGPGPGGDGGDGGGGGDARGGFLNNGRFDQRYADGGVTGSGNIDLHVPINIGGGSQGGGGFGGGNGIQQGGMPQPPMGGLGSLLGQTQPQSNAFGGGMGGIRSGLGQANQGLFGGTPMSKPSYEQYLAGRGPYQQDLQLSREQYENPQQGPSTPGNRMADGGMTGMADGGLGSLGGYSDGGRLLRGPGDGVSDSIPATIGEKQPARLADGEFVVPARIVSELGNGSTEAGARQLYAMMDRIQKGRKKTVGKNKVAANTRSAKHLPA